MVRRRTEFELRKAEARYHILEGLKIALDHLDEVIKLIRASKTVPEARDGLMTSFALTQIQSKLAQVRNDLPPEAQAPVIELQMSDSQYAIMYISFDSDTLDPSQITDYYIAHPDELTEAGREKLTGMINSNRKSLDDHEDLAYYIAAGQSKTTLTRLAVTAGARWSIEGGFESAKQEAGLADYEVRSWTGWYRHVTLSLLAQAVLAAVRKLADGPPQKSRATVRN